MQNVKGSFMGALADVCEPYYSVIMGSVFFYEFILYVELKMYCCYALVYVNILFIKPKYCWEGACCTSALMKDL
jgi:hypothetical protein